LQKSLRSLSSLPPIVDEVVTAIEGMPRNDAKEVLKALTPGLDDLVGEAVGEDLARERGYVDLRRLALEDIVEGLKV